MTWARHPRRGRVTRVPTADSDSTSKSSPTAFGTIGRLRRPATDWHGIGTPPGPQRSPQERRSRDPVLGPKATSPTTSSRQGNSVSAPSAGGHSVSQTAKGRRVEGSHRRLGRWPASWRGSPKDPHDHSVDSPSRERLHQNPGAHLDSVCRGHLPSQ